MEPRRHGCRRGTALAWDSAMVLLRNILPTVLALVVAAACGWFGTLALRQLRAGPAVQAGDYRSIVAAARHPVVLFATTTCRYCRQARQLLETLGVDHAVLEIDASDAARRLFAQLDASGVPVLVTNDVRILGFDEAEYRSRLAPGRAAPSH